MPDGKVNRFENADPAPRPTTVGVLSRSAAERVVQEGIRVEPLLKQAGLPLALMTDRDIRIDVRSQIDFLNLVAETLGRNLLGFQLARDIDLRGIGPLYYLFASCEKLGDFVDNLVRLAPILNEGVQIRREANAFSIGFEYSSIERHPDRHQAEFLMTCVLRMSRLFTNRELIPTHVEFLHHHEGDLSEMERYFGCSLEFGALKDRIEFDPQEAGLPLVTADPFLNRFLMQYFEERLAEGEEQKVPLRTLVENAITPRLPHGTASIANVAKDLGMSARTLSRRLAQEHLTFSSILEELRENLAVQYLHKSNLSVSQIAWRLGYAEVSSFAHAFQRWTGQSPTHARRKSSNPVRIEREH